MGGVAVNLDINTLMVINVANLLVMAVTLPVLMGRALSNAARSARNSLIVQAVGWILMIAAGQWIGHWMDRVLSTASVACTSVGMWWMFTALQGWLGPRRGARLLQILVVLTPLGYGLSFDSYPVRVGWSNLLLAAQLGLVGSACLRPQTLLTGRWRWATLACLWTMAGFTAARGILGAFFTELYPYFRAPTPLNVAAMVAANITLVLGNLAVLIAWRTEAEDMLNRMAHTDALTGLLNRRGWNMQSDIVWADHDRHGDSLALLMLDLDHFKQINDSAGHDIGDQVIRAFAGVLQAGVRRGDVVARMGGEEFAVLMPHADEFAARSLDKRLRELLGDTSIPGWPFRVTFSVGLALADAADPHLESVLTRADNALYQAKHLGRNRLEMAAPAPSLYSDHAHPPV